MYTSQPAWSFQKKYKVHKQQPTPSPNAYQPSLQTSLSKSPSWKIGKELRNNEKKENSPGPDAYIPKYIEKSPKFGKFGTENRSKQNRKNTPGPGAYILNQKSSKNSFSIAKKYDIINTTIDFPGPGQYEILSSKNKRGIKLNRQKRFTTQKKQEDDPGPGKYEYTRPTSATMSFSKAQRMSLKLSRPDSAIGPGQYEMKSLFDTNTVCHKGFSLGSKSKEVKITQCPGPSTYSPKKCDYPLAPSPSFAVKFKEIDFNRTPSPDQYRPNYKQVICKTQNYSIGKAERQPLYERKCSPGPGAYVKTQYAKTGPDVLLIGKRSPEKIENVPGPGSYNPKKEVEQKRPQSAKIGKAKRFNNKMSTQQGPAPGSYENFLNAFSPQYSFTRKKKLNVEKNKVPGPGYYEISSTIANLPSYVSK